MNENHEKKIIESARKRAARHYEVADLSSIIEFAERPFEGEPVEQSMVLGTTTDSENEIGGSSLQPGTIIHQYKVLRKIGEGGMGEVYLAQHLKFKSRLFAIKLLRRDLMDAAAKKRFEAEISAMEFLKHGNIVYAHDAGEFNDVSYLVMDYVEGVTIKSLGMDSVIGIANCAEIIRQTAIGLQHAYENKMVHRDIKPSNLVLNTDGQVKILDMGLARINDSNPGQLTATQQVLGTPDYMAPEQWQDTRSVDIRADIYSLGCTLYYLLAGRAPFEDNEHSTLATKLSGHLQEPPPKIQLDSASNAFEGIEQVLRRMLEKNPDHRFQNPKEVAESLEDLCGDADLKSLTNDIQPIDIDEFPTKSIQDALEDTETRQQPLSNASDEQTASVSDLKRVMVFSSVGISICILLISAFVAAQAMGFFAASKENNTSKQVEDAPSQKDFPVVDAPLLLVNHFSRVNPDLPANHEQQSLIDEGEIGNKVFTGKYGDLVKVHVRLDEPKYAYLVALNPSNDPKNRIQLCFPSTKKEPPGKTSGFVFPEIDNAFFPMTDGIGQLAFVLIKSDIPLPDFETWEKNNLLDGFPWELSRQTGVWKTNNQGKLIRVFARPSSQSITRGDVIYIESKILAKSIQFLESKKVEVVALAFPVLEK